MRSFFKMFNILYFLHFIFFKRLFFLKKISLQANEQLLFEFNDIKSFYVLFNCFLRINKVFYFLKNKIFFFFFLLFFNYNIIITIFLMRCKNASSSIYLDNQIKFYLDKKNLFFYSLNNNYFFINFKQSILINFLFFNFQKWNIRNVYLDLKIFFLRREKIFNKGRYSRNRQVYRTGVYWCLYINIIAVVALYYWFYRFVMNFGYFWLLFYSFLLLFFFSSFFFTNNFKTQLYSWFTTFIDIILYIFNSSFFFFFCFFFFKK